MQKAVGRREGYPHPLRSEEEAGPELSVGEEMATDIKSFPASGFPSWTQEVFPQVVKESYSAWQLAVGWQGTSAPSVTEGGWGKAPGVQTCRLR